MMEHGRQGNGKKGAKEEPGVAFSVFAYYYFFRSRMDHLAVLGSLFLSSSCFWCFMARLAQVSGLGNGLQTVEKISIPRLGHNPPALAR